MIVLVIIALIILFVKNPFSSKKTTDNTKMPTNSKTIKNGKINDTSTLEKNDAGTSSNTPSNITLSYSFAGQDQDKSGGPIVIRTIANGADGGQCEYKLTNGSNTKSFSSDVTFSGTYYSCNFTIPYDSTLKGNWSLNTTITQNGKTGSASTSVNIRGS